MELLYVAILDYACMTLMRCFPAVRLENEHLGNMDQYRVTREVPLPYAVDDRNRDSDDKDDEDEGLGVKMRKRG